MPAPPQALLKGRAFQPGVIVCCTHRPQLRAGGASGVGLGSAGLASVLPGHSALWLPRSRVFEVCIKTLLHPQASAACWRRVRGGAGVGWLGLGPVGAQLVIIARV